MNTFTFKLGRVGPAAAKERLQRALRTGIPYDGSNQLLFGSVESMLSVVTRARVEVFAAIVENKPDSLQSLAKHLGKDLGNVSRDTSYLEALGLITLRKEGRKLRPVAKYSQIALDFSAPERRKGKAG